MKICTKCGNPKDLKEYGKNAKNSWCRECKNELNRELYIENPAKAIAAVKKWAKEHPDYMRERDRKRCHTEKRKAWRVEWCAANREKVNQKRREWWEKNKESVNEKETEARHRSEKKRISNAISSEIKGSLRNSKNGRAWQDTVGYTLIELISHLQAQFIGNMSWDNYGREGWHIDYIIPISAFNYESYTDIDFKRCWSLNNLRPLWAFDNISKHGKVERPFQPSLCIELQAVAQGQAMKGVK